MKPSSVKMSESNQVTSSTTESTSSTCCENASPTNENEKGDDENEAPKPPECVADLFKNLKEDDTSRDKLYDGCKTLIENGLDVNGRDELGRTPLECVMIFGQLGLADLIEYLIFEGACVDIEFSNGYSPVFYALLRNFEELVPMLLSKTSESSLNKTYKVCDEMYASTTLMLASAKGMTESVKLILRKRANPNICNEIGKTALHLATEYGKFDAVKMLISSGACVNAPMTDGTTPLHLAAANGYLDIAMELIKKGASVEACVTYGRTPLHLACEYGHLDIVQLLITHGANDEAVLTYGQTPLHLAAHNGFDLIIFYLLDNGADINAQDMFGLTPLHAAVLSKALTKISKDAYDWKKQKIVDVLLTHGANTKIFDRYGQTALDLALNLDHNSELVEKITNPPAVNYHSQIFKSNSNGCEKQRQHHQKYHHLHRHHHGHH